MDFDHAFSVAGPIDEVWALLGDVERVVPCIPNTRLIGRAGENSYDVEIEADVGLLTLTSKASVTLTARDDATHSEGLQIVAHDGDGNQLADATATIVLSEGAGRSLAAVHTSVEVGGIGRLVAEDKIDEVANRTFTKFGANLEALLK
jgi:carbon monoxide dehydrogenase subunit G